MKGVLEQFYGSLLERYQQKEADLLPFYLKEGRQIFDVSVFKTQFVLVSIISEERFNITALKKQLTKYREIFGVDIAYGFRRVSSFQRKALVENGIPFVSCNEQVFLPFLGSYFSKIPKEISDRKVEKLSPSSQLLALFMFYGRGEKKYNKNETAVKIGLSPMSVTRAVRELVQIGIMKEERYGNEILISWEEGRRSVSDLMPYLINPVQNTIFVEKTTLCTNNMLQAGEWSLAERSMLAPPKYEEYAIVKNDPFLKTVTEYDPDLDVNRRLIKIQKWKYDPLILGNGSAVDPVSLICSFQNEEDERIKRSLEEVQGEIEQWRTTKR